MSDNDEMTALARSYLDGRERMLQQARDAFSSMPPAPLAVVATDLISAQPNSDLVPLLKCIAELNQGRVEDLNLVSFQSYLISECATSDIEIRKVINAVKAFLSMKTLSNTLVMAARDEDNSGRKAVSKDEILRLAKKRVR